MHDNPIEQWTTLVKNRAAGLHLKAKSIAEKINVISPHAISTSEVTSWFNGTTLPEPTMHGYLMQVLSLPYGFEDLHIPDRQARAMIRVKVEHIYEQARVEIAARVPVAVARPIESGKEIHGPANHRRIFRESSKRNGWKNNEQTPAFTHDDGRPQPLHQGGITNWLNQSRTHFSVSCMEPKKMVMQTQHRMRLSS